MEQAGVDVAARSAIAAEFRSLAHALRLECADRHWSDAEWLGLQARLLDDAAKGVDIGTFDAVTDACWPVLGLSRALAREVMPTELVARAAALEVWVEEFGEPLPANLPEAIAALRRAIREARQ